MKTTVAALMIWLVSSHTCFTPVQRCRAYERHLLPTLTCSRTYRDSRAWTKWTTSWESQKQVEGKIKSGPKSETHTQSTIDWQLVMAERMHLSSQGWQNDHADMITSDRTIARGDELSSERCVQPGTRHNSQLKSDAHTEQETVRWRNSAFTSSATRSSADSWEISGLSGRQLQKTRCSAVQLSSKKYHISCVIQFGST